MNVQACILALAPTCWQMHPAARITNTCIRNLHAFSSYSGCSAGTYYSTTGADDAHQKEKSKHLKFMQYWMELVCVRKRSNDVEGQIVEARAEPTTAHEQTRLPPPTGASSCVQCSTGSYSSCPGDKYKGEEAATKLSLDFFLMPFYSYMRVLLCWMQCWYIL